MMKMLYRILLLSWCMLMTSSALPIESKPLNNNPESWNLSWLVFAPRNSSDPSAEALVSSDPHVKKSKITPKSIFIAPSAYSNHDRNCPLGYRIDDNGKCIKTVTINQDDILAARLSDLFGNDDNSDKNGNSDADYYDFDEDKNENSGPLQINLPLAIDIQEETSDGKKVEYIVEEKIISMRNLNPKNAKPAATEEITTIVPAPVSEKLFSNDLPTTPPAITTSTEIPIDDLTTTTLMNFEVASTDKSVKLTTEFDDLTTTTMIESTTAASDSTTIIPSTTLPTTTTTKKISTTSSTTTTTQKPVIIIASTPEPFKVNSVEFMPKITQRKPSRIRNKNIRTRKPKPILQQAAASSNNEQVVLKSQSIQQLPIPKKNRTRNNVKRRKLTTISTTTTSTTQAPVETSRKPSSHYWIPKGWALDETTKEKPVLIRFWAEQPLPHDERARSHNSRHQRVNSRMPTEGIFREITVPELEGILKEN